MREATIERIKSVYPHPNADKLELVQILGYQCVVPKNTYERGDLVIYIKSDTVLPDSEWSETYRKYAPKRVKAVKLRGEWSEGIIAPLNILYNTNNDDLNVIEGLDITDILGVEHYEPPIPKEMDVVGYLPYGIGKTDEDRAESLIDKLPFGKLVDVTLKIDGQSCSYYYKVDEKKFGILGRNFEYVEGQFNPYNVNAERIGIKDKLIKYCEEHNVSLCLRGEQYGNGIQKGKHNPHAVKNLGWAMFSVYLIDEREYAHKGHQFYYRNVAKELEINTILLIEEDVILTPELITKYSTELTDLNGVNFEGVVIKHTNGSFKVINKYYDSIK